MHKPRWKSISSLQALRIRSDSIRSPFPRNLTAAYLPASYFLPTRQGPPLPAPASSRAPKPYLCVCSLKATALEHLLRKNLPQISLPTTPGPERKGKTHKARLLQSLYRSRCCFRLHTWEVARLDPSQAVQTHELINVCSQQF